MKLKSLVFIFFLTCSNFCFSQVFPVNPVYYSAFDPDSLKGFDETAARAVAISQNYIGAELKIKMYRLKREYIDAKYNLVRSPAHTSTANYLTASKPAAVAGCINQDFEASMAGPITSSNQVNGWVITAGYNGMITVNSSPQLLSYYPLGLSSPSFCDPAGCCPLPTAHSAIIDCSMPGGYIDNEIGPQYPVFSVFGTGTVFGSTVTNTQIPAGLFGTKVLRLNDPLAGDYSLEKLTKSFSVTAANAYFQYAFISVLASAHTCCDAGGFIIRLIDASSNATLSCGAFSVAVPSNQCSAPLTISYYDVYSNTPYSPSSSSGNVYNPWLVKGIDLSPYIGHVITLEVIVSDCNAGGHFSYLYFDSQCGPVTVDINNTQIIAGDSVINHTTCDSSVSLNAPAGFSTHTWIGPAGFSSSNANINVNVSGNYILTLNQPALCAPITKTVNITFASQLANIVGQLNLVCSGEPVTLTAVGFTTNLWSTGSTAQSIVVNPAVTTSYSITGVTALGCLASVEITQAVAECAGINKLNLSGNYTSIYPNPNNGEFILEIFKETGRGELSIENALGQVVHKQNVSQGKNTIRTKGLAAGIYYYTVTDNKQVVTTGKLKIE